MVAADDHGSRHLPAPDEVVDRQTRLGAIAETEPADPRGEPLERDALGSELEPPLEEAVVREETSQRPVNRCDVLRIARQDRPAEGADAAAEERPDIGRDKARV
jgi:hypothetical protein